jgi:protein-tyrosine-phosphatase
MAEIYLFSLVDKDNALALRVCDVVSAGVSEVTPDQKLHPRKLERLFKANDLLQCWPQKPERLLVPEDVVEFDHILLLNEASPDAPYSVWAEDNPDEAEDMQKSTKEGEDWRANFKTKVLDLSTFCSDESQRGKSFLDPVQPGQGDKFGVKFKKFEQAFAQVKDAVDQFLLRELRFNVEEMCFLKRKTGREGLETPSTPGERVGDLGE